MRNSFLVIVLVIISVYELQAQSLLELNPELGWLPDLSVEAQNKIKRRDALSVKGSLTKEEQKELDLLYNEFGETTESIWDIIGGECSWYCGEGPYKVIASSFLPTQGENSYLGEKAHDLSFKTAWVEGATGYGIGEYVEYYFRNEAPRINEIKIFNGYVKSEKAWTENSRVRKLKLSVNGKDFAILNLADTKSQQSFKIDPLGRRSDGKDLILRFTIMDVYKGSKYNDTCITEIYFDGLDVHCFAKGTKVQVAPMKFRNIEDLQSGDTVLSYDQKQNLFYEDVVEEVAKVIHQNLVRYIFMDGSMIIATPDHPFLTNKGWASLNPSKSGNYIDYKDIAKLKLDDKIIRYSPEGVKQISLRKIELIAGNQETYTISKLKHGKTFLANGMVVGVEEVKDFKSENLLTK